jgi:2'-5' RNA ligase
MADIRSFVAIELPEEAKMALADLQRDLKIGAPPRAVRWVQTTSIHLTLQFLGDVAPAKVEPIGEALRGMCADLVPLVFEMRDVGVFPNPRRPRVVWVGVAEPQGLLVALQKKVTQALEPLGFEPEKRPYTPHLTLGRASDRASPRDLAELGDLVGRFEAGTVGQVSVDHITLMKSDLTSSGAVYTPLAVVALGK